MRPTHSQHIRTYHSETNSLPADRIIRPFFHPPPSFLRSVSSYTFFSLGLFFLSTDPLLLCSMLRSHSLRSQSQRDQLAPSHSETNSLPVTARPTRSQHSNSQDNAVLVSPLPSGLHRRSVPHFHSKPPPTSSSRALQFFFSGLFSS